MSDVQRLYPAQGKQLKGTHGRIPSEWHTAYQCIFVKHELDAVGLHRQEDSQDACQTCQDLVVCY